MKSTILWMEFWSKQLIFKSYRPLYKMLHGTEMTMTKIIWVGLGTYMLLLQKWIRIIIGDGLLMIWGWGSRRDFCCENFLFGNTFYIKG